MATRRTGAQRTRASFNAAAKRIEKLSKAVRRKVPSGLRVIGEEIMTDVKASRPGMGVPVDTGVLRGSGRVIGPLHNTVELSFGSAAAFYALEQHENTALHHRLGEARYLVRGVDRWKANGASVKRALDDLRKAADKVIAEGRAAKAYRRGSRAGRIMALGFRGR